MILYSMYEYKMYCIQIYIKGVRAMDTNIYVITTFYAIYLEIILQTTLIFHDYVLFCVDSSHNPNVIFHFQVVILQIVEKVKSSRRCSSSVLQGTVYTVSRDKHKG